MHRKPLRTYGKKPNNLGLSFSTQTRYLNFFHPSDSDDSLLTINDEEKSSPNNPFESTFDRIAKTAKLPPLPPDYGENNSILYVSSSSSSSLSDENWVQNIEEIPKIPAKKLIYKKRGKKINPSKKKIEKIPVKRVQTNNRKRPNNLQQNTKDETKNIEASQPQRKTRREMKEHETSIINSNSNSDESNVIAESSNVPSLSIKELKSCSVELIRIKITENDGESNNKLHSSVLNNENIKSNKSPVINNEKTPTKLLINKPDNELSNIKDCRIVLSRLDVNSIISSSTTPNSMMLMSSTPFINRVLPSNLKPSFSPISDKNNCTNNGSSVIKIDETSETQEINDDDDKINRTKLKDNVKSNLKLSSPVTNEKYNSTNDRPSTNEIDELNETHEADNDKVSEKELKDSVESLIESSVCIGPKKIFSQSNVELFEESKKNTYHVNEKSTQLMFTSYDDIDNFTDNNSKKLSDVSVNLTDVKKPNSQKLISSSDNSGSSIFYETSSHIDVDDNNYDSQSNYESYEDAYDTDKSLNNKNKVNEAKKNSEISREMNDKSDTSFVDQTMSSLKIIDIGNKTTSSNKSSEASTKDTSEDSYHLFMSSPSSKNSLGTDSSEIIDDKEVDSKNSSEKNNSSINVIDNEVNNINAMEPVVLLTRLNDPGKITRRRNKYVNWDRRLGRISEKLENRASINESVDELSPRKFDINKKNDSHKSTYFMNTLPRLSTRPRSSIHNKNNETVYNRTCDNDENKILFLKPGKSWARSLSILHHINNTDNIELLSKGKGKKWRESVKNVLDMQSQGVLQSCIKNNENENDERAVSHGIRRSSFIHDSSSSVVGTVGSTSPSRFIRRISIRVVPDNKYSAIEGKDIKDTSFLEVYGIPTNRKTIGKKSTSIASRDTFVYNLRCSNADITSILPEPVDTARNVVLQRCNQMDCIPFEECYPETFLECCRKIGEGVYGEVFLFENRKEKSVIKIIPIEGDKLVNGEPQKKFCEILSEIIIAEELHNLRSHDIYRTSGFVEVKNIRCLIGKYPQRLIEHWQEFDDEKTSDNDCPSMFNDDQLFIALELGHGGQDLEAFVFQNATEAYISFIQTALTLAVAEKSLDFEHRDLHWGNILISRTSDSEITYKLGTEEIIFPCKGLKVAIIDFTLSRMSYQGCCIFNDLALDPALFTAMGEYQFEIYKLMKAKVGNNWQLFDPYTNILWLHYILDKMIKGVRYKKKTTKIHKNAILKLQELKDIVLDYDSAYDFITNCDKLSNLQRRNSSLQ